MNSSLEEINDIDANRTLFHDKLTVEKKSTEICILDDRTKKKKNL